ncbi:hypothetical protein ACFQ58_00015 [Agromyces sp. NPDC056523]|uniref:hypothetical protein n=1 Tax=Agromyces sp. NPDC056523 TaxID=3345850 RepID=UPI003671D3C5
MRARPAASLALVALTITGLSACSSVAEASSDQGTSPTASASTCRELALPLTIAWNVISAPEGEIGKPTVDGMLRSAKKELAEIAESAQSGSPLRASVEDVAAATGALSSDAEAQDRFNESVAELVQLCSADGQPLELTGWYGG